MRLWSLHPRYLDAQGLVALWREGLLAQKVLRGETRGYRHHPQLDRFRATRTPTATIARYLREVRAEAMRRGYAFDGSRIGAGSSRTPLRVTRGQLAHEWAHLMTKLERRQPDLAGRWRTLAEPEPHPMFAVVDGGVADWERQS